MQVSRIRRNLKDIRVANLGYTPLGLQFLTGSVADCLTPEAKAWHGYCLARDKKAYREGISLCNEALLLKPEKAKIYLALGRIYLLAGRRIAAIKALRQGLPFDKSGEIDRLLSSANSLIRFDD